MISKTMTVESDLSRKKEAVDRELDRLLESDGSTLSRAVRYAVFSGGKRYRPLLVLCSGESFGAGDDTLLPFACALELVHNYSLIHDDLPSMDNDEIRRGKPTCHKVFGEGIALLAGDALLTLAFEVMSRAPLEKKMRPAREKVIQELGQKAGIQGMIGGQFLDISLASGPVSEAQLEELILKKTGALIIASIRIGAILGGASKADIDLLTVFGRNLGLAFQTRDDILDSAKDREGKSPARPNSVTLFGRRETHRRLERFVGSAIGALERSSIHSEGLGFLARCLLDVSKDGDDEVDS